MTRQIALVRTGESPAVAFEMETQLEDNNVAVLLQGLQNLYHVLSVQNRELAAANQTLEEKVQQRSAELQTANTLLQHERNELRALLVKVEASQNQLLQSEKMASVGLLAAGIAHEINNPVGFVNSNLGTLKDYVERLLGLLESTSIAWHPA